MKNQTYSQTILKWLRQNGIKLGALTSTDTRALYAAVHIADCWICGDLHGKPLAAAAFRNTVLQMQKHTQFMAFHAIAHVGEWCHRWELWHEAELPKEVLEHVPECSYGPRKQTEERTCGTEPEPSAVEESKAQLTAWVPNTRILPGTFK
jgi:hypothetical protein